MQQDLFLDNDPIGLVDALVRAYKKQTELLEKEEYSEAKALVDSFRLGALALARHLRHHPEKKVIDWLHIQLPQFADVFERHWLSEVPCCI